MPGFPKSALSSTSASSAKPPNAATRATTDLTAAQVAALGPGFYRVATNLYLRRERATGGWWMLLYQSPVTGKRTEMSLGPYELINTTQAKMLALKHRVAILERRCPLAERRAAEAARKTAHASKAPTFRVAFDLYLAAHESGWRNAKHRAQWSSTVETYAYPVLADLPVDRIGTAEVMQVLERIWYQKPETASRLRGRIENVLAFCRVREWRQGENPAAWKGHLAKLLPARDKVKPEQHHAALAWQELPTLYQKLAQQKDVSALALRYVLLTVLRTSEALGMPAKGEISRVTRTHTLPPERTKAHRVHRTPLSTEALAVLDEAEAIRTGATYLFNSGRGGQLSDMALLMKLRGLYPDRKVTVHGLRSSFRDWCSEHGIPRELAERQLAHTVRDATEAAYLRSDALDPRRRLMERWSKFLLAPVVKDDTKVTSIEKERHRRAE